MADNTVNTSSGVTALRQSSGENKITIKIRSTDGTVVSVTVDKTIRVGSLKDFVRAETSVEADHQRLIFQGKEMEDDEILETLGVGEGMTINLVKENPNHDKIKEKLQQRLNFPGLTMVTPPNARNKESENQGQTSSLNLQGSLWNVRGFQGGNVTIDKAEMGHSVVAKDCQDTTIHITNKIAHIELDRCERVSVEFVSLVAAVEIVNCKEITLRWTGRVGTVQVDLTDGLHVHLKSDVEGLVKTKYINANSSNLYIYVEDKELKFTIPASMYASQLASRVAMNHVTNELQMKTLSTDKMKSSSGPGYINLALLDSNSGLNDSA
eukprot:TRINITY_DN570_c0_g1_i1.p1 TRINITY_DN570_c0_g1~~TRINITY_DN570_c0_g1_i1.p1  ORF type:complete len:324 (+),score=96.56 TRINITY_DN570_c0_g1_i1:85-1056(+)